ncbi:MAG: EamA family transporter [Candidatus Latescibacterota bacterium]
MNLRGIFHLIVVYVVWGSTYLAIRVAVREGSGFPAFTMAASRVVIASIILFAWARISGLNLRVGRRELAVLFASGILLWVGGNGLVSWAERSAESGYSALIIAALPLWVAIMESVIDRRLPTPRLIGALLIGFAGVAVLNGPVILGGAKQDMLAAAALIMAAISWGIGTILQRRKALSLSPEASSGYQQFFGGIGLFTVALLTSEPKPAPLPEAWAAWSYLIVFGSLFAFTSFVKALRLLPINVVMTYAYVNPVVAVILGGVILGEPITIWTIAGSALIILGVMGVFYERRFAMAKASKALKTAKAPKLSKPSRASKTQA